MPPVGRYAVSRLEKVDNDPHNRIEWAYGGAKPRPEIRNDA